MMGPCYPNLSENPVTNHLFSQFFDVSCSGEHFYEDQLHFGVTLVLYQIDLLIQS